MAEIVSRIGTGGEYATIAAWLTASANESGSLDTVGGSHTVDYSGSNVYVGELLDDLAVSQSGTNNEGAVHIAGAPTTATSYRVLRSDPTGPRRTVSVASMAHNANQTRMHLIHLDEAHSRVVDIEARVAGTSGGGGGNAIRLFHHVNGWGFLRCVARDTNGGTALNVRGFVSDGANDVHVVRCVIHTLVASGSRAARACQFIMSGGATLTMVNCTVHDCQQRGVDAFANNNGSVVNVYNNLVTDCGTDFQVGGTGTGVVNRAGNMSSDATGDSGLTGIDPADQYVALSPFDFHLLDSADAVGAGVDASSIAASAAIDIDGDAVTSAWDIGADQTATSAILLDAEAGAVPITGQDATLQLVATRTLDAEAGAVPITGQGASLLLHRLVAAEAGAVPIAGAAVTFRRIVYGTPGVVPITGHDADLRVVSTRTLDADAGSVPVSGQDAELLAHRRLGAEAGSTPITGQDANLILHRRIDAEAGAVPLTGHDATLTLTGTFVLQADTGTVPVTGASADLALHRRLSADAGSVAIAGTDAQLVVRRRLAAVAGAVPVTGHDATLVHAQTLVLVAEAGVVPIAGGAALLAVRRQLAAEVGALPVVGGDVAFTHLRRLLAAQGSLPITGRDIVFSYRDAPVGLVRVAFSFDPVLRAAFTFDPTVRATFSIGGE